MNAVHDGDICPYPDCKGKLGYESVEDCSCHISPPCSACLENPLVCQTCSWTEGDEIEPPCEHNWVDARNKVIVIGEICLKCNAVRA